MMKKFLFALMSFLFVSHVQAGELKESTMFGKGNFETLNVPSSIQPEVVEFFSFYCGHCYNFEYEYQIPQKLKATLPKGTTFKQYHVVLDNDDMKALAQAWVLAQELKVEDKVKKPLFDAAQTALQKKTALTKEEIRQVLLNNGVTAQQYDDYINGFKVTSQLNYQMKLAKDLGVAGTPDVYVNGKYHVLIEGLSRTDYVQDFIDVVNALLKK